MFTQCESIRRKRYVSLASMFVRGLFFKDSTWRPTGNEQLDWFVPCEYACDYVVLVHT